MGYLRNLKALKSFHHRVKKGRWIPSSVTQLYTLPLDIAIALVFWPVFLTVMFLVFFVRFVVQSILRLSVFSHKYTLISGADSLFGYKIPNGSPIIHGVSILKGTPDLDQIRARYENVVFNYKGNNPQGKAIYTKLKKIFSYKFGFYCWKDASDQFKIQDHVKYLDSNCMKRLKIIPQNQRRRNHDNNNDTNPGFSSEVVNEIQLMEILSELMNSDLPDSRPQWEQLIIPNFRFNNSSSSNNRNSEFSTSQESFFVCINRVHHGYADGASLGMFMDAVIADEPVKFFLHPLKPFPGMTPLIQTIATIKTIVQGPSAFLKTLHSAMTDTSKFRVVPYSSSKILDWSDQIDMELLKLIKVKSGASIPSILLSSITSALEKAHIKNHSEGKVPKYVNIGSMSVMLPYPNQELQNHFTTMSIKCPLKENYSIQRLKKTDSACKTTSFSSEPKFNFLVMRSLGYFPKIAQDFIIEFAGTPILFSNVPGVISPMKFFNSELVDTGVWLPLLRVVGLGIATYSYCGKLRICVTAESKIFSTSKQLQNFLNDILSEIENLAISYKVPFNSKLQTKTTKYGKQDRFNQEKG